MQNIKLINFTDLNDDEKYMVLSWRNHPTVKKWMHNSDDISLEEHLNFIKKLKNSKNKFYFLVQENGTYIGVIDFINISSDFCEFGLYANIALKGKGKGNLLIDLVIKYAFNNLHVSKLIAEVYIENERAISLYKRNNFLETHKKLIDKREVLCMELNYENRCV